MRTIHKFPIALADEDEFTLPIEAGARVLTVHTQGDVPCVWAMVDTTRPPARRRFRLAGTGHDLGDHVGWRYVGTFQMRGGSLVFHLFEEGPF